MKSLIRPSNVALGSQSRRMRFALLAIAAAFLVALAPLSALGQGLCPPTPINVMNNCFDLDPLAPPGVSVPNKVTYWNIYNPYRQPVGVFYPQTPVTGPGLTPGLD